MENSRKQRPAPKEPVPPIAPLVGMGHIIGAFGVQGWVKIAVYTETTDSLLYYPIWWLRRNDKTRQAITLVQGKINGNNLIVKFKQCINRDEATKLKGMQIAIARDQLPLLPDSGEGGYYWSDLIGTTVTNLQSEELGIVVGLLETGANDVLRVQKLNEKERLIPFINSIIADVDLKLRRITVDWGIDY